MNPLIRTVFHGDNGRQEFYQTAKRSLLLLRLKREKSWVAYNDKGYLFTDIDRKENLPQSHDPIIGGNLPEVLTKLLSQYGIKVHFDKSKRWEFNPKTKDGMPMILKMADGRSNPQCVTCEKTIKKSEVQDHLHNGHSIQFITKVY